MISVDEHDDDLVIVISRDLLLSSDVDIYNFSLFWRDSFMQTTSITVPL